MIGLLKYRDVADGSVYTARKVPTAMVFVRCKDGISHHPTEYSSPEDWYEPMLTGD